jgi:hypothetical protein
MRNTSPRRYVEGRLFLREKGRRAHAERSVVTIDVDADGEKVLVRLGAMVRSIHVDQPEPARLHPALELRLVDSLVVRERALVDGHELAVCAIEPRASCRERLWRE